MLIAIITQAFYNIECGRYALYCNGPLHCWDLIVVEFARIRSKSWQ